MSVEEALGWLITVECPGAVPEVYNVAVSDDRQALEAVKRVLGDVEGVVLKVKAKLTAQVFKGLHSIPAAGRPRLLCLRRGSRALAASSNGVDPKLGNAGSRIDQSALIVSDSVGTVWRQQL